MMSMQEGPAARRISRLFVFPILMVLIMIGTYIPAMRAPQPHDVAIGVVGVDATVMNDYQQELGDRFHLVLLPDAATARQQVEDRSLGAALVLVPDAGDRTVGNTYSAVPAPPADLQEQAAVAYVATAAGSTQASASLLPLQTLAMELGTPLVVRDLVGLNQSDSAGIGSMFFAMAVTLAGFISVTTISSMAPNLLQVKPLAIAMTLFGAFVSFWVWFLTHVVVGAVDGPFLPLFITGLLTVVAAGFAAAVFTRLLGPLSVLISLFIFIALGMTASGASVPVGFVPGVYRLAHNVLTFPATTNAVKSVMYFDGAGLWSHWLVLVLWIVAGMAALELVNRWKSRSVSPGEGRPLADSASPEPAAISG